MSGLSTSTIRQLEVSWNGNFSSKKVLSISQKVPELIESFQKTQISKIQTIQPGRKSHGTVLVSLERLSSFPAIPENTVLFATKNVWEIQTKIIA